MKKNYQTPKVKAVKVQQTQMLCGSIRTEKLEEDKFIWDDEEE